MSKTTDKAAGIYQAARENEYVNRLIEDPELRERLLDAVQSARAAFDSIVESKKSPVNAVSQDKKVQRDLRKAAESLKEATEHLREPAKKRKKKKGVFGKLFVLALAAVGVTLAVSEDARKLVLDTLFGPEEEFEYTSTTNGDAS
jgi:ferric-dicitrate binding protein FerR (iron transport regulator)